ncbi:Low affinity vacuolar monovalent cation/H(+) antiporter [Tolypocladium paradoxum]|uniref:Low affinity vacuolar monovalent cation/H(+) antiporter n=1 Tax=Tolypocladium paradoxum TaxID=94208 RepID=A0A2S4KW36_9HYPO|nr:Low affinity vacuolar monovalent cation/H(+) antiporter [Tolypocladium paradoxum]
MDPSHQEGTPEGRRPSEASSVTSPTDGRHPYPRADPATRRDAEGLSESFQSTDTVRLRPEGAGYGERPPWVIRLFMSPGGHADAVRSAPGSIHSSAAATATDCRSPGEPSQDRSQQRGSAQQPRPSVSGTDRGKSFPRLRKPPLSRRTSSNTPHRGAIFSADDDPHEVLADAASRRDVPAGYSTRRRQQQPTSLPRLESYRDADDEDEPESRGVPPATAEEDEEEHHDEELPLDEHVDCESDGDISDAESFTLKDRQQAINQTHPFGIRVWKPALYKKDRSIQKFAQADIHSTPGGRVSRWLLLFNLVWTLCFGWWMASLAAFGAVICLLFAAAPSGREYGRILWGLAAYLFYPFGKFVRLEKDEAYIHEDGDEGRSISEYEQWQSGDLEYGRLFFGPDRNRSIVGRSRRSIDSEPSETDSLLGRGRRGESGNVHRRMKRRLFGRGEWNIGRVIFFIFFYCLISPSLILVSAICWFLVFWIPMGKVTILLFDHLRRHPLALSFESHVRYTRAEDAPDSSILLCTYRAVGSKYWKYTIDGTNIFLINLMAVVMFVIFDWLVLQRILHLENLITSPAFLFTAALLSIIPLAYFIGQAVASISAQSSMGLGAAINALFATVVEVFLYCVALKQGKSQLVEGSIVGSIFAGILFLPGISMCFGAIKRKTQRFNAKSAGVTSTMLLFAVVGAFGPTLFYQIYGTHELNCLDCEDYGPGGVNSPGEGRDCRRCYFSQTPALDDRFYLEAVRPYCYLAAAMLFFSYLIGLWFTLRTHAAVIWNAEIEEKRHEEQLQASAIRASQPSAVESSGADIRDSNLYKRILGQSLKHVGLQPNPEDLSRQASTATQDLASNGMAATPHVVPPKGGDSVRSTMNLPGLSQADNTALAREVAEIAATAATIASRDRLTRKVSSVPGNSAMASRAQQAPRAASFPDGGDEAAAAAAAAAAAETGTAHAGAHGGHDAPNWGRTKSAVILLGATILYAVIAEILVDTVDVVLESFSIDQKFLGITLFALVPNTTEFLNAISFAMNGNIALSMEIGSAYALQVCLLQIPCLVLYSALYPGIPEGGEASMYTFALLFPQWDMVTVILCVFLLSYVYGEGKSNYFKGSILILTYLVVMIGYFFSGYTSDVMGVERFDVMGTDGKYQSYKTIGRSTNGRAYQS